MFGSDKVNIREDSLSKWEMRLAGKGAELHPNIASPSLPL